jgi:hypothetical protein
MGSFYSNWDKKDTKNTKKQMSVKNAIIVIKAQNGPKNPILKKQLHISLTTNRRLTTNRLTVAVSEIY